jgi:outer membrane protein OmpA-like peptidoglycan-associated protein
LRLRAIRFEFGSDRLKSGAIETLRNLGGALNGELRDHDRLEAVGKGSSQPAVPKNRHAAQNRRGVVVNLGA